MPTPIAASAFAAFASRFDCVITPGQAMVAHRTSEATAAAITARRAGGASGDASSRSTATARSASTASEIGQPTSTSTRAEPPETPEPVTL